MTSHPLEKYLDATFAPTVFFRSQQNRLDLIPEEVKSRRIKTLEEREDWFSLGRLYRKLEEYQLAAQTTCMGVVEAIDKVNVFSAAFYLKEMISEGILDSLFIEAMAEAEEQNDLWWQYRCLEELEWESEAKAFLLEHRKEIEALDDPDLFNEALAIALDDKQRYKELRKAEARSLSARPDTVT